MVQYRYKKGQLTRADNVDFKKQLISIYVLHHAHFSYGLRHYSLH